MPDRAAKTGLAPIRLILALGGVTLLLAACSPRPHGADIHDPFETVNRAWFERNLALEQAVTGRGTDGTEGVAADEAVVTAQPPSRGGVQRRVRRVGSNLSHPSYIVNDLLQLRPDRAMGHFFRFAVNSTVGLGGLFDPAAAMGLHARPTDFGETMHRWGANEGAFVVLPLIGPTTERDAAGTLVDVALNPFRYVLGGRESAAVTGARLAGRIGDRAAYDDLIDANVMRATDPYAQARLLFLQARRHHLGEEREDDFIDPYADFPD